MPVVFELYPWLLPVLAGIFGLIIGSFLNVVIYRLPIMLERQWEQDANIHSNLDPKTQKPITPAPLDTSELNLSLPRSHCPKCKSLIPFWYNIPLLSWIMLKGKCHHCNTKISARYPLIELLTACASSYVAYKFGYSPYTLCLLGVTYALICLAFIDADHFILPDNITLPLLWAGIIASLIGISPISIESSLWGAIAGYLSLWSLYWGFKLITGKEGLGYGDFKLFAAAGAWLGWMPLPSMILIAAILGIIGGIISLKRNQQDLQNMFPFGPYLALGFWIILIFKDNLFSAYFSLLS